MQQCPLPVVELQGVSSGITIRRPAPGIAVLMLCGTDVGEFGDFAMREIGRDLQQFDAIDLFIDARAVKGASVDVSSAWAFWMSAHRTQLRQINMLTGTRYVQITADFVRRFVGLVDRMKIFTDQQAFDETLLATVRSVSTVAPD